MELKKILTATAFSLFVVVLHVGPVFAGDTIGTSSFVIGTSSLDMIRTTSSGANGDPNFLPAPGILGLVAAAIVGTIFLVRRGK